MTTTARTYFLGTDHHNDTCLWHGTGPDDPRARVVAYESNGGTSAPGVPAELFRVLANALAPTDEVVDRLAKAVAPTLFGGRPDDQVGPGTRYERNRVRENVRVVLRAMGGDVLA